MKQIFIDGAVGTTGLEIRERLAGRADLSPIVLPEDRRKDAKARREALNDADAVILCLPDDAAREAVALIDNPRTKVIDASTAHRTADHWAYGFAEMGADRREILAAATQISNPGCYPTGFIALARPLVKAGIVPADYPFTVNAVSGYSGGGKALIARFEDADDPHATGTALRAYGLDMVHKHVPEMLFHAGLDHPPAFLPSVARAYRGMLVEVPLHLRLLNGDAAAIRDALTDAYQGSALVSVESADQSELLIERCAGTDRMELFAFGGDAAGQVRLVAALDNLGKGAAGAAVQNLNLALGLEELSGLRL